jgi:hypothetical protein
MAEGGEGGGKAGDLYLGVVDLFAVILPGALLIGVLWMAVTINHIGQINNPEVTNKPALVSPDNQKQTMHQPKPPEAKPTEPKSAPERDLFEKIKSLEMPEVIPKWLVFLIVSYIVGHFLFALGAWIMDPLYDGYYKRHFEFEVKKELPSMRRRADRLFHEVLGKDLYFEVDNRLTWTESLLTIGGAAAKGTLDRLEADSKFFRSLAVVATVSLFLLFSPLTGWIPSGRWKAVAGSVLVLLLLARMVRKGIGAKASFDRRVKLRLLNFPEPEPKDEALPSRFDWTDAEWLQAEVRENRESQKSFRRFAVLVPIGWTLLVILMMVMVRRPAATWAGFVCWLVGVASAWRYMEIRAKRLVQAYYFVIALNKSSVFNPAPAEKKP